MHSGEQPVACAWPELGRRVLVATGRSTAMLINFHALPDVVALRAVVCEPTLPDQARSA